MRVCSRFSTHARLNISRTEVRSYGGRVFGIVEAYASTIWFGNLHCI